MGEIADDIIEGSICAGCMMPFAQSHGYPVVCPECKKDGYTDYEDAIYLINHRKEK